MKRTLLSMVQNILSAMDSDDVNSVGDTLEAMQVAEIVRETYEELFANIRQPSLQGLMQLTASTDLGRANILYLPPECIRVDWIKYNGKDVYYLEPERFIERILQVTADSTMNVPVTNNADYLGARIGFDQDPTYWTTFDNNELVFDSWNKDLDDTLQSSKALCYGEFERVFRIEDDFVPFLDSNQFPMLLAEAKSVCFVNLKQVSSQKEEQRSRRQQVRVQNDRWRADQRIPNSRGPDYGRRAGRYRFSPR